MRAFIKRIIDPFIQFWFKKYYKKPRRFRYADLEVLVYPEVFPPHFTFSTKILLNYIKELDMEGKTFLELGCGSGIISLFASSKGAKVTATDINKIALNALKDAKVKNHVEVDVLYSDLFENVSKQQFDFIFINPPYYPRAPKNDQEKAWFCGEEFEYFQRLFQQISKRPFNEDIYMILSQDCNLKRIFRILKKNNLTQICIDEKKVTGEINYIYKIKKNEKF
ncbi:methyltransferase [Tenacibaculum retecalamus]|uniref:methyltransferase n=1 Tax=Tenacibaculum retecalamus TaxID=3018315 RepID=UPI0023D92CF0|nr:methyltransferase [Tenacibaculum retecalamus]WBX71654.1 methyltransferase [Tenacibaculum retecalamus]